MDYAIIRHNKLKSYGAIAAVFQHNARLKTEPNVDPDRSGLNRLIDGTSHPVPATHGWLNGRVRERLRECEIELGKKDTVLAIEVLMATSPEWWDAQGPEGSIERKKAGKAWMEENIRYLNERFGPENVLCISLHMDEKTPHMHAVVTPIMMKVDRRKKDKTPKPTLCAKDFLGNDRKGLSDISQAYGKRFDHLNLRPGLPTDKRKKPMKHMPIKAHHDALRHKRETLDQLIDEKMATRQMAIAVREIITFVAQGDISKGDDGQLIGTPKALAALKNAPDKVGQQALADMAGIIWDHIDKATAKTRDAMSNALAKILDDQHAAAEFVKKAETDRKAAEEAKKTAQDLLKTNKEQSDSITRVHESLTRQVKEAQAQIKAAEAVKADRKAAEDLRNANDQRAREIERANGDLTQRLLDAKLVLDAAEVVKANRKAAEEAAQAAKNDREAAANERQAIESRITVALAAEEAAQAKRTLADARSKAAEEVASQISQREVAVEAAEDRNKKANEELNRKRTDLQDKLSSAENDRSSARKDREIAEAFLVGIEAFNDGKILRSVGSEDDKLLVFSPKLSANERDSLNDAVTPAWDRIWTYVKAQTERFKLVDRLIKQAKSEAQRWQSLCAEAVIAIAKLPNQQASTEVQQVQNIISTQPSDNEFDLLVSQWNARKNGLGM